MKTKMFQLFLTIMIILFTVPSFALDRIVDNADLLSAGERKELLNLADSISLKYNFDLVIVTEKSIGKNSPMDYADDFFDYNGYGLGEDRDGCLFLQVTGSRDIYASTSGRGIGILNDAALDLVLDDAAKYLQQDNPYKAYLSFLTSWEKFLALDAKGRSYNFFEQYNHVLVGIAWALALLIGFITVQIWKIRMNTALPQTQAAAYVVPDSLAFKEKRDRFLYSTVTKTKRQSSSSGGSRSHTSSSGRSHGGGGRRY